MKVDDIRSIAIVGAGLMGHAMAQEFALAGYEVHTYNRTEEKLQQTIKSIQANLQMLISLGMVSQEQAEQVLNRKWGQVYGWPLLKINKGQK